MTTKNQNTSTTPKAKALPSSSGYVITDGLWGDETYKTMLEAVKDNKVIDVWKDNAEGSFVISEMCDEYYKVGLTAKQLRALGGELIALSLT